jgi:hypothetical protein
MLPVLAERIDADGVRRKVLCLVQIQKVGPAVQKLHVAAIKFFFREVLRKPEVVQG